MFPKEGLLDLSSEGSGLKVWVLEGGNKIAPSGIRHYAHVFIKYRVPALHHLLLSVINW